MADEKKEMSEKKPAEDKKEKKSSVKEGGAKTKSLSVKDVLSKDKASKSPDAKSKSKKAKYRHSHLEYHQSDGSVTSRHTPVDGGDELSYSSPNLESALEAMRQHVGGGVAGGEDGEGDMPPAGGM